MKKYIAEFIGTFGLTLAVLGSLNTQGGVATALIAGITLGLFVFTIGHISGAHINPAVTVGAWSLKKIELTDAIVYILAQFAGAALAILLGRMNSLGGISAGDFSWPIFAAEAIGTLIFTFGIASVVLGRNSEGHHAPFVIGGSLTLGASLAAALGANGILNPAVAFGLGSLSVVYIVAPIIGSLAGMWLYKILN